MGIGFYAIGRRIKRNTETIIIHADKMMVGSHIVAVIFIVPAISQH